jgi:hypothetical protein
MVYAASDREKPVFVGSDEAAELETKQRNEQALQLWQEKICAAINDLIAPCNQRSEMMFVALEEDVAALEQFTASMERAIGSLHLASGEANAEKQC